MRRKNLRWQIIILLEALLFFISFIMSPGITIGAENQISIRKTTDIPLNMDIAEAYDHIQFKIKAYATFRVSLLVHLENGEELWLFYSSTTANPSQAYSGGPITIGIGSSLVDQKWHTIERDINLDLESFVLSKMNSILEIELLGNYYDLAYIQVYRFLEDGSRANKIIDDFSIPDQSLYARGWESDTINKFKIYYDSNMLGYLEAKDVTEQSSGTNQTSTQAQTTTYGYNYPYDPYGYNYPYGYSYPSSGTYSNYSPYYGTGYSQSYYNWSPYGNSGYYGNYYGGNSLYGGAYGGYYGMSPYSGLYGMGYNGGLYGNGYGGYYAGYSPYTGLYGGIYNNPLRYYYGGPIGSSGYLPGLISPFI